MFKNVTGLVPSRFLLHDFFYSFRMSEFPQFEYDGRFGDVLDDEARASLIGMLEDIYRAKVRRWILYKGDQIPTAAELDDVIVPVSMYTLMEAAHMRAKANQRMTCEDMSIDHLDPLMQAAFKQGWKNHQRHMTMREYIMYFGAMMSIHAEPDDDDENSDA